MHQIVNFKERHSNQVLSPMLDKSYCSPPYKVTWAYIAGFLDGDGWITRYKPKQGCIRITCGFTQSVRRREGMEVIQMFLKDQGVSAPLIVRSKGWKSDVMMVNILISARASVIITLENVLPYLILKRDLALESLELARRLQQEQLHKRPRRAEVNLPMPQCRRLWTAEEVELLKTYYATGYNIAAIAVRLYRSCNAVSNKWHRLHTAKVYDT
jgi:hypothetical protein